MRRAALAAGIAALIVARAAEAKPVRPADALPTAGQPDAVAATRAVTQADHRSALVGAPLVALLVGLGTAVVVVGVVALKPARSPG